MDLLYKIYMELLKVQNPSKTNQTFKCNVFKKKTKFYDISQKFKNV